MVAIDQTFFYKLLNQTHLMQDVDVNQIDRLLQKYPAFHSLYILKGMALKNESEEKFEQGLPQIATNVLDRAQLYDTLFTPLETMAQEEEDLTEANNSSDEKTLSIEEVKKVEPEVQAEEIIEDEKAIENKSLEPSDALELKEKTKEIPPIEIQNDLETETNENLSETVELEDKTEQLEQELSPPIKEDNKEILSFVEWLKQKNTKSSDESSKKLEANNKTSSNSSKISEKKDSQQVPFEAMSQMEAELIKSSARQPQSHLDSFISCQIAKKKNKKKFTPQNAENKRESDGLISETLAEILFLQKKYEEAISIYEKLSLKYPQKSSYFASRIQKIKKII